MKNTVDRAMSNRIVSSIRTLLGAPAIEAAARQFWLRRGDIPADQDELVLDGEGYHTLLPRLGATRRSAVTIPVSGVGSDYVDGTTLITVKFMDEDGLVLEPPYEGFIQSDTVGHFKYLKIDTDRAHLHAPIEFPELARSALVSVRLWKRVAAPLFIKRHFIYGSQSVVDALSVDPIEELSSLVHQKGVIDRFCKMVVDGLTVLQASKAGASDTAEAGRLVQAAAEMMDFALGERIALTPASKLKGVAGDIASVQRVIGRVGRASLSVRRLGTQLARSGFFSELVPLLEDYDPLHPDLPRVSTWVNMAKRNFDFRLPEGDAPIVARTRNKPVESGIYVLHNSMPYHSGGYATRAQGLIRGFSASGLTINPILRYGYPVDRVKVDELRTEYDNNGVIYRFSPDYAHNISTLQLDEYISHSARHIARQARQAKADFIKAASFFTNGLPAARAAQELGLPYIYEMRGMAWITKGSDFPAWMETEECAILIEAELSAARQADHVFAITGALRDWLISKGIDGRKISLLPNAINQGRFVPTGQRDIALAQALGIGRAFCVGYIGSFQTYEGIEHVIEAFEKLRENTSDPVKLLLVGDGPYAGQIAAIIAKSKARADIISTGRVPHDMVARYYSLLNVSVLARKPVPVCEMISPMKPFELFAMKVPVLSADVAALVEIVKDGERGYTFTAGDVDSLYNRLIEIMQDPQECARRAEAALEWVNANRTWEKVTQEPADIIRNL